MGRLGLCVGVGYGLRGTPAIGLNRRDGSDGFP